MNLEEKKQIIEQYVRAYNSFEIETMLSLFHPECHFENVAGGETTVSADGLDELRGLMEQGKNVFSSREQTIVGFSSEADAVMAEINYRGKLKIDLPNGVKAGDELNLEGRSEFVFADDGLIKSLKDYS
jgi:hypothetical protein